VGVGVIVELGEIVAKDSDGGVNVGVEVDFDGIQFGFSKQPESSAVDIKIMDIITTKLIFLVFI
jgi:hypothetical protein